MSLSQAEEGLQTVVLWAGEVSSAQLAAICCCVLHCLFICPSPWLSLSFGEDGWEITAGSMLIFVQFPNIPSAFLAASCSASPQPSALPGHVGFGQDPHPWPLGKHLWDLIPCISLSLLQDLSGTSPLDGAHPPEMSVY